MLIKKPEHNSIILNLIIQNKLKVLFLLLSLTGYTTLIFLIGGIAYKDGIFGKVIKPIIEENI